MPFRPTLNTQLNIGGTPYRFTEHPTAKGMPYGQTGRRATVYQVQDIYGRVHALKVFAKNFRTPQIEHNANALQLYTGMPGLQVCARIVLTSYLYPELTQKLPDLEYAVLMPWAHGQTWQEMIVSRQVLTPDQSLMLARGLTAILADMEKKRMAHCDLSGANILASSQGGGIALVDVEEMYAPKFERPQKLPAGSSGYAHRTAPRGYWGPEADRFAGAILIVEMLGWCEGGIQAISGAESFFLDGEMQTECPKYNQIAKFLFKTWGEEAASLFHRAWFSNTLEECPSFSEWLDVLQNAHQLASVTRPLPPPPAPNSTVVSKSPSLNPQKTPPNTGLFWGLGVFAMLVICVLAFSGGVMLFANGIGSKASPRENNPATYYTPTRRATQQSNSNAPIVVVSTATRTPVQPKPATNTPRPTNNSEPTEQRAQISDEIYFAAMRKSPGYSEKNDNTDIIAEVPSGAIVKILGGPKRADGLQWWRVSWNGHKGWIAGHTGSGKTILIFNP